MRQRRWWFVAADAAPNSGCAWRVLARAARRRTPVAYQINDLPMVKLRWTASADGTTASYREDADRAVAVVFRRTGV